MPQACDDAEVLAGRRSVQSRQVEYHREEDWVRAHGGVFNPSLSCCVKDGRWFVRGPGMYIRESIAQPPTACGCDAKTNKPF